MFPTELVARVQAVAEAAMARGLTISTAESCTGGLVAALLTEVSGVSAIFERGFVTYHNQAKIDLLGVPGEIIGQHGAVSRACALAMAEGALQRARADIAVAVTGIAGPGGGSAEKPVGLVHFAAARRGGATVHVERRFGDRGRAIVRMEAVSQAVTLLENALATG